MEELSESKENNELTLLVKEVVQGIIKAKKLLKMYPPNNPVYIKTADEMYSKINKFFEVNNDLSLIFRQNEIISNSEQVYYNPEKDDNLALLFFKDGIREIKFLKGLIREEFEGFINILNTDFETVALDDDIVTLLWEQDFEHIKYLADEDMLSDEYVSERDKIYEEIEKKTYSDDDLLKAYEDGLQTAEKKSPELVPISGEDLKYMIREIGKDGTQPKIDKILILLTELLLLTKERALFSETVDLYENAIAYCIEGGDFKRASFIVHSVKSLIENKIIPEENIKILKKIYTTINSEHFIKEICRIIDSEVIIEENEFLDFLQHLDKTPIPFFIQRMGNLRSIKGKRLIINALLIIGKLDTKTLAAMGLQDSDWFVVRNTISILGKIADTGSIQYLTGMLSHPDERVRKEAINTISSIGGSNALPHLKKTLNDSISSIRRTAARRLGNIKSEAAKKILLTELSKKDFSAREFAEKKEFYEAIARCQDQEVKDLLLATLKKKKFWGKTRNDETRACAAYALGIIGYKEAIPSLKKVQGSKNKLLKQFSTAAIRRLTT